MKRGFRNKTEAKDWHDDMRRTYDPAKVRPKKVMFEEVVEEFNRLHLPTIKIGTAKRYLIDINRRILPFFKYREANKIAPKLLEQFKAGLKEEGLSDNSANKCLGILHLIFKKAEKWGMIHKSPYNLDPYKIAPQPYKWWDQHRHIQQFLKTAKDHRYFAVYATALSTGMRLGEIMGLSKQDVNFERMQIHIWRQWHDKHQCYGTPKNNKPRYVPMNQDLARLLREVINRSPDPEVIFTTKTGYQARGDSVGRDSFKRLIQKAGVPDIRFHDLRHTFASWYMINGGEIYVLKEILGHSTIKMTERYAHLAPNHLDGSIVNFLQEKITPDSLQKPLFRVVNE